MTPAHKKRLEEEALARLMELMPWADEKYCRKLAEDGRSETFQTFLLGAEAYHRILLEGAGEFDEQAAKVAGMDACSATDIDDGGEQLSFKIGHLRGARWQHAQSQAEIQALKTELENLRTACRETNELCSCCAKHKKAAEGTA